MTNKKGWMGHLGEEESHWEYQCGGCKKPHNSFWKTIVLSDEWQQWEDSSPPWDVGECRGAGWISPAHWKAFVKFLREKKGLITEKDTIQVNGVIIHDEKI